MAPPVDSVAFGVESVPIAAGDVRAFGVFKIAGNGEPILLEDTATLEAAVARVGGLRTCFPGEYLIVSQGTGRRILFTKQGVVKQS